MASEGRVLARNAPDRSENSVVDGLAYSFYPIADRAGAAEETECVMEFRLDEVSLLVKRISSSKIVVALGIVELACKVIQSFSTGFTSSRIENINPCFRAPDILSGDGHAAFEEPKKTWLVVALVRADWKTRGPGSVAEFPEIRSSTLIYRMKKMRIGQSVKNRLLANPADLIG